MKRPSLLLVAFLFIPFFSIAQRSPENYRMYGLRAYYGTIFAHSKDIQNTAGARPFGIELEWATRFQDGKAYDACKCSPSMGFLAGYTNFDSKVLGSGWHAAYFVEHYFLPRTRLTPTLRGATGLVINTRPYNEVKNPTNQSYSTWFNAFLQLQVGVNYRVGERHAISAKLGYNHLSNGGIKEPNKGVNWPNVSIGYLYMPNYIPGENHRKASADDEKSWQGHVEIAGSFNTRTFSVPKRYLTYGASADIIRQLSNLHTLKLGLDWHYAQDHKKRMELAGIEGNAQRLGLLFGHEFLFGSFVFSQSIGVYLIDQFRLHDPIYHRWELAYVHKTGLSLGINLKAHRNVAEFVDVRLGYRIK